MSRSSSTAERDKNAQNKRGAYMDNTKPPPQHKLHRGEVFHRCLLLSTGRGLLSLKVIVGVQESKNGFFEKPLVIGRQ